MRFRVSPTLRIAAGLILAVLLGVVGYHVLQWRIPGSSEALLEQADEKSWVGEGFLRSRINFGRTLQRHWTRGKFASTSWDGFSFTSDNPLNRLIKYTLWYCGKLLDSYTVTGDALGHLVEVYSSFDQVPLDQSKAFIPAARSIIDSRAIPTLRHYYYEICRTCLFIVGNESVSLKVRGTDVDLLSFVLNLEDLFERYVRNVLRKDIPSASNGIRILDGNKEGRSYLFFDSRAMEVRPDIVVRRNSQTAVIADVKYKLKITENDRYQLIAHAYSYGVRKALFVIPSFDNGTRGLVRRGQMRNANGIEIYEYHMRLDADLEGEERRLCESMTSLLQPDMAYLTA